MHILIVPAVFNVLLVSSYFWKIVLIFKPQGTDYRAHRSFIIILWMPYIEAHLMCAPRDLASSCVRATQRILSIIICFVLKWFYLAVKSFVAIGLQYTSLTYFSLCDCFDSSIRLVNWSNSQHFNRDFIRCRNVMWRHVVTIAVDTMTSLIARSLITVDRKFAHCAANTCYSLTFNKLTKHIHSWPRLFNKIDEQSVVIKCNMHVATNYKTNIRQFVKQWRTLFWWRRICMNRPMLYHFRAYSTFTISQTRFPDVRCKKPA